VKGEYIMTQEQLTQLLRIYNTLGTVATRGEDTIVMGDCLRALLALLNELSQNAETVSE
jgi:hypothetical protein